MRFKLSSPLTPDASLRLSLWLLAAFMATAGLLLCVYPAPIAYQFRLAQGSLTLFQRLPGLLTLAVACGTAAATQVAGNANRPRASVWILLGQLILAVVIMTVTAGAGTLFTPVFTCGVMTFLLPLTARLPLPRRRSGSLLLAVMHDSMDLAPIKARYEDKIRAAAAQEERNRLARDLHDSVKQQLFAIQTSAATAQQRLDGDPGAVREALDALRASARDAISEMQIMLDQMKAAPLESVGLVEALKRQVEALGLRTGAEVRFESGPVPNELLAPGAPEAIFRVAQEALSNVARHSGAKHVRVSLGPAAGTKYFELAITDDGRGFDRAAGAGGAGIRNMTSRAQEFGAMLEVQPRQRESGTSVRLLMPAVNAFRVSTSKERAVVNSALAVGVLGFIFSVKWWAQGLRYQNGLDLMLDWSLPVVALLPLGLLAAQQWMAYYTQRAGRS